LSTTITTTFGWSSLDCVDVISQPVARTAADAPAACKNRRRVVEESMRLRIAKAVFTSAGCRPT
jgi:hypothetical protein